MRKLIQSSSEFESWMEGAMPHDVYPWEVPGAKQPEAYTWEEYVGLPMEYQIPFQNAFAEEDGFALWYEQNCVDQ